MPELNQVATPVEAQVVPQSELPADAEQTLPGEADTPEKVAGEAPPETDEQKNARVLEEARQKAERKARGVQKRIDELTADKHAERRRAEQLAQQNAEILAMLKGKQAMPAAPEGEPTRDQFQDDVSFLDARARYFVRHETRAATEEARRVAEETFAKQQAQERQQAAQRSFLERQREAEKAYPDYSEVMDASDVVLPQLVLDKIRGLPEGPTVAYHIAKNPQLADRFKTADPSMHDFILGQISATVKPVNAPPPVSKAPAPGKPAASRPGTSSEPPSDPEAYFAWAQKNMR